MREKLKNIEILRFIFIIQIMLMHLVCSKGLLSSLSFHVPLFRYLHETAWSAYVGVDYFFIISGFFLYYTFRNMHSHQFILHKIKRFLPTMLVSLMIIFLLSRYYSDIRFDQYRAIYTITFTASFMPVGVGYSWFIGPLFWASLFYFYTLKHFDRKYLNILFSILIIASYSILVNNTCNNFSNASPQLYRFLNVGVLRALAGMGIGYFIGQLYTESLRDLRDLAPNRLYRTLFTIAEALLLFFIIYCGSFCPFGKNAMIAIFAFVALFILFLLKWGHISRFLDNNVSVFLGKYVFTIYVLEEALHNYLRHIIPSVRQSTVQGLCGGGGYVSWSSFFSILPRVCVFIIA